jgi:hypothetical protein
MQVGFHKSFTGKAAKIGFALQENALALIGEATRTLLTECQQTLLSMVWVTTILGVAC